MAAKTDFHQEDFQKILSQYSLGQYVDFKPFEKGLDQTNLLLTTTSGKFALRYYENRSEDYVTFEIDLLHFLADHSYPCAAPLPNSHGKYFGVYKNKPYAVFEFLEGQHSEDNDRNYPLIAQEVAKLNQLTTNHKPASSEYRTPYDVDYCWQFTTERATRMNDKPAAQARLDWLRAQLDTIKLPDSLPKGVCHCDANPTNFLYRDGKITAVLDFDQASYIWLIYDIAKLIDWWTWPDKGEIDFAKTVKLLNAYQSVRPLATEEKDHIYDALKLAVLIDIGWFFNTDSFANNRRKVEYLTNMGRQTFHSHLSNAQ